MISCPPGFSRADQILDISEDGPAALTKNDVVLVMASQLKPLPAILTRLASQVSAGNTDLREIAETIRLDPVLTLQLLRSANSASSGVVVTISTVEAALGMLGLGAVISMAFAVSVGSSMAAAVPAYGLTAGELWRHSAAAAVAAESLVRIAPDRVPPATMTAALLHDIGKLIVTQCGLADGLAFVHRARQQAGLSLNEAESEVQEMNHAIVGYIVTQHWGLPERICRAIMGHHNPQQWKDTMCDAVHLANLTAHGMKALQQGGKPEIEPSDELIARLALRRFDFAKFCVLCQLRFSQVRSLYNA